MPVCASAYCRIFNIKKQYSTEMCGCRHFGIRFCLRPHICIRVRSICRNRARTSEIPTDKPMSVTIKQVADKSFGTPPIRGRGCLRLLRERFHHEFAILHHILLLFLQFEKNHDFSRACPHPQLNTILRLCPSTDAQKACSCVHLCRCICIRMSRSQKIWLHTVVHKFVDEKNHIKQPFTYTGWHTKKVDRFISMPTTCIPHTYWKFLYLPYLKH